MLVCDSLCDSLLYASHYAAVALSLFYMDTSTSDYSLLSWNVRGLNSTARQEEIKQVMQLQKPLIICLQETKLMDITPTMVLNILGHEYRDNYCFLPAEDTRGGILLALKGDNVRVQSVSRTTNTISAMIFDNRSHEEWMITGVYGPQSCTDKKLFIVELRVLKQTAKPAWLILGDFNLIYRDEDKNNGHLNWRMMDRFRRALNHLQVKEILLIGRRFTWSNQQSNPVMTRIDRVFCTTAWEELYSDPTLHPLSSYTSDHCPLLLLPLEHVSTPPIFRFEAHWPVMLGFHDCVSKAWNQAIHGRKSPMMELNIKLSRTSKALRTWSRTLIP